MSKNKGTIRPDEYKIAIRMPLVLFQRIKARAIKQKKPISVVAADLLACGLLDVEESEAHEPEDKAA